MGRGPEVFVRPISMSEGQRLARITRTSRSPVRLRRAMVVLASAQGQSAGDIAPMLAASADYVRRVIHDFNDKGFAALDPKWSGGRPKAISDAMAREICLIARCSPADLGLAHRTWSLATLREHVIRLGVVSSISRETLRQILTGAGIRWGATKTWKASPDPTFITKMGRVLALYDHPPADGRVICVDEFGPLNLQPRHGRGWRPARHPVRIRATYTRPHGVRHMLAALDLATGKITYRIRDRKRWREFRDLLNILRARYPGQKLYVIVDNFSPHHHPQVRAWAADNNVELVFLPTYASWLNWIEPEFAALRYFALAGTDFTSHTEQGTAIAAYIRWRNTRAQPKTNYAPDSVIRTWTHYPTNVA